MGHDAAVLALQHHGDAEHRLAGPVLCRRALSDLSAEPDRAHGPDEHRRASDRRQDDVLDVVLVANEPHTAHELLLAAVLDVGTAGVRVVPLQRLDDMAKGQPVGRQAGRIDQDFVLQLTTSEAVDFDDARHRAELRLDEPVERRSAGR